MWNMEKESYKSQEVGSGVHRFIKDILECKDIFNLSEGRLATPIEKRANEYIHEKKTRDRRRADFVIYINSEIIIPIEAEQYTHIPRGEGQLLNYQVDLDKKYGILTDGYTWRFYNNNVYKKFTLDSMLSEPEIFLEFWREYIKPEYYYLYFFEETGQLTFIEKEELYIEKNQQLFFEDITRLISSFRNKLSIEGYFKGIEKEEAQKKATEISYAYIIQFILYKTLVDNKFGNYPSDFEDRIDTIRRSIKNSDFHILGAIDGISHHISENVYRPFLEEQDYIRDKLLEIFHRAKNQLSDVSPWLDILVFVKKYNFSNVRNDIFGYIYENYLKELYQEEQKGQYFTHSSIVDFMLDQIGYEANNIGELIKSNQLDKLSIVDPACGSGTFLYSSTREIMNAYKNVDKSTAREIEAIVTNNVFGLEVEEFPLYLAEMSMLMRMLPLILSKKYNNPLDKKLKIFLTQDTIAEFIGAGLISNNSQLGFPDKIVKPKFDSFLRNEDDLIEMKDSMTTIPRRRFDYVVANPPYISYKACAKQKLLSFELMKQRKIRLNDIFGVNLHSVPSNPKRYRPNPNLYAFFLALGVALLKAGGKLCYIIPQTLLIAGDLDVLRYHLASHVKINRIITFVQNLFIDRGLRRSKIVPTSSLIIVIQEGSPEEEHLVEITNYMKKGESVEQTIANIRAGKNIRQRSILQSELLDNYLNWNYITQDQEWADFHKEYIRNSEDISIYYEHSKAETQFSSNFYFDSGYSIDEHQLLSEPKNGILNYRFPRLIERLYTVKEFRGYWPNIRQGKSPLKIELRQANQEYNLLDCQYKIIWSYVNPDKFHLTDNPVIWARNRYCSIGSDNYDELLYLFGLLNSSVTWKVLTMQLESESEKDFLVSTKSIKQYIRVPVLNNINGFLKEEIIKQTKILLSCEERTLDDLVDMSNVLMQEFDDVSVDNRYLVLSSNGDSIKLKIKEDANYISKALEQRYLR